MYHLCTSSWLHWLGLAGQRWDTWAQRLIGTEEWNKQVAISHPIWQTCSFWVSRKFLIRMYINTQTHTSYTRAILTEFSFIWFSIVRQLNELLGEHAAAVTQDVALELGVGIGKHKLHYDGVSRDVDANLHVLTSYWGDSRGSDFSKWNWAAFAVFLPFVASRRSDRLVVSLPELFIFWLFERYVSFCCLFKLPSHRTLHAYFISFKLHLHLWKVSEHALWKVQKSERRCWLGHVECMIQHWHMIQAMFSFLTLSLVLAYVCTHARPYTHTHKHTDVILQRDAQILPELTSTDQAQSQSWEQTWGQRAEQWVGSLNWFLPVQAVRKTWLGLGIWSRA